MCSLDTLISECQRVDWKQRHKNDCGESKIVGDFKYSDEDDDTASEDEDNVDAGKDDVHPGSNIDMGLD